MARYRARTLDPQALLAIDDHLAECAVCRAAVAVPGGRLALDDADAHLTYEQLEAIAEGRSAPDEHLRECEMCAAELADLRKVVRRRPRVGWWVAAAAAAVLAVFVATRPGPVPVTPVAQLAPADAAAVAAALAAGDVAAGPGVRDWQRDREQLLGAAESAAGTVVTPVAETVERDRPVFRWTAVQGVAGYRVEVYDAQFNPVAQSGLLNGTEWQPEQPLARGQTYTWIVQAGKARFPQPPAPEARFAVLEADAAAELDRARGTGSKLLVAVTAGRLGLWPAAAAAADEAVRQNPADAAIGRLRDRLAAKAKNSSGPR